MSDAIDKRVRQLCEWYGDGHDSSSPTPAQWRQTLERPVGTPLTLINFFKL